MTTATFESATAAVVGIVQDTTVLDIAGHDVSSLRLEGDLGLDAGRLAGLVAGLEDRFGVAIDGAATADLQTVGHLARLVVDLTAGGAGDEDDDV
ncbi:acyl carrier protein [Streptomyces bambusae]|uniref:acyl carrier protein n=1 Tax=Streptomyces bambusae TaxID=1550616 RepID=UPI001CFD99AD|nr:acyl carrier protein [Streptomyces bambusae]MCB5164642.1 acyl carrier protein [Streptomyces bambusae]